MKQNNYLKNVVQLMLMILILLMTGSCAEARKEEQQTNTNQVRETEYRGKLTIPAAIAALFPAHVGQSDTTAHIEMKIRERIVTESNAETNETKKTTIDTDAIAKAAANAVIAALSVAAPSAPGAIAKMFGTSAESNDGNNDLLYAALTAVASAAAGGSAVHLAHKRKKPLAK